MGGARALAVSLGLLALAAGSQALSQSSAPGPPSPGLLAEGRRLAVLGDCEGCHDRPGGAPFAGGYPLATPFGTVYSANITSDPAAGLGAWSEADFYRAMHQGLGARHEHLYPAFPYPYFTRMPRADVDALWAYLRTVPPSPDRPPPNRLVFPVSIRAIVGLWNWLNFHPGDFQPTAGQSDEWNRGAYIVNGPGHCGAWHTPKNLLAGDEWTRPLQGGLVDNWFAPDLNGDAHGGLADWSQADIVEFLKTGRNPHSSGSASMALIIQHSTSLMNDADLAAIALYLKSQPPAVLPAPGPDPGAPAMQTGAAIYRDQCASCHRADGQGVARVFPTLAGSALAQAHNPTTVLRYILTGSPSVATAARPTPIAMPAFAWKLSDAEIADVATYVRGAWGNAAPPVTARQVGDLRRRVAAHPARPEHAAPGRDAP